MGQIKMRQLSKILAVLMIGLFGCRKAVEVTMTPKEECERLMNTLMPFAEQILSKHGEFYPFGGVVQTDGKSAQRGAYDGDEHPPSQNLIDIMTQALQSEAKAGKIRASAIIYDVRVIPPGSTNKTDAVCVALDHKDGYAVNVFFPYSIGTDKKVVFQPIFAQQGAGNIFKKPNN